MLAHNRWFFIQAKGDAGIQEVNGRVWENSITWRDYQKVKGFKAYECLMA